MEEEYEGSEETRMMHLETKELPTLSLSLTGNRAVEIQASGLNSEEARESFDYILKRIKELEKQI